MPTEVEAAIITATAAIVAAIVSSIITWLQIRREKTKWLADLKTSYSVELHKARLVSYPSIFEILGKLSKHAPESLTPEKAQHIANEIHEWLYSNGGLYAEASTRGALKELRAICSTWQQQERPLLLREWRHSAMFFLRRDLDIHGYESFNPEETDSLLKIAQASIEADIAKAKKNLRV